MAGYPFQDKSLSAKERTEDLLSRLTVDEKIHMLSGHQEAVERLGVPEWYVGTEVARGYVARDDDHPSTVFPQPIGLAATFDPALMMELGDIAATEARAYYNQEKKGGLMLWGPTVDMERDPRWGRTEEAYGEEPFLTGEMTAAYTLGMRGKDKNLCKSIPTLKHFFANNEEEHRCDDSSNIPLRLRHEYYYAAFRPAITRGGAMSMMAAYNAVNGEPCILNHDINPIVKGEWGLSFVVTDGGDLTENVTAHRTHTSHAQSIADAIHAGIDSMSDDSATVHTAAYRALEEGLLTEADIDKAVGAVLEARFRLGLFDETPFDKIGKDAICTAESAQTNLRAAREGIVLLKNENTLPLKKEHIRTIAVIGATAGECFRDWYTGVFPTSVPPVDGIRAAFTSAETVFDTCYDRVILKAPNGKYVTVHENGCAYADADSAEAAAEFEQHVWGEGWVNFFAVNEQRYLCLGDGDLLRLRGSFIFDWFTRETFRLNESESGIYITEQLHGRPIGLKQNGALCAKRKTKPADYGRFEIILRSSGAERAKELAERADAVICCVGNDPVQSAKECYDRTTLALPPHQKAIAQAARAENPNTVLAVISSYPYDLRWAQEEMNAILYSSHGGPQLGTALADVLCGAYNPAGCLPMTWYRSEEDLPDLRDYDVARNRVTSRYFDGEPLYPFGFGLSYAAFAYSDLHISTEDDGVQITLNVTNTAAVDGEEVVQVYYCPVQPSVPRPLRQLCAFSRVKIGAGETVSVHLRVMREELAFYDVSRQRFCVEDGDYTFTVGAHSRDSRLSETVHIHGETVPPRDFSAPVSAVTYDDQYELTEQYSLRLRDNYLCCKGWNGTAIYKNVDLRGCTALHFTAASVIGVRNITLLLNGAFIDNCTIQPGDGYDDFREYTISLPEHCGISELVLCFSQHVGLRQIWTD